MKIRSFVHKGLKRLYEDDRRPQRHMEFKRYAQSPLDFLDRRRAANLWHEFRGLPL